MLSEETDNSNQQALTVQQAIDRGVEHHNAGRLSEAGSLYNQILQSEPNHPVAMHLLGVVAHQIGKNDIAVDLIAKALVLKPDFAEGHNDLGLVLQAMGKLDDAVTSYHKALEIKADYAEAHSNLGLVLQDQGKLDDAVASYNKALAIKPDFTEAHSNFGLTLQDQGKLDDAVTSYRKAIAIKPNFAKAHNNLGNALKDQGKLDDAVTSYSKALAINPHYAEAHNNLGLVLQDQGKLDDAVSSYRKALAINPDYAEAHNNLGLVLQDQGKLDDAVNSYSKAFAIKPDYAEAYNNLGKALNDQGKLDDAVTNYRKAIALKPDLAEAHYNLGNALQDQGKLEDAVTSYRKAIALKPNLAAAHSNLGLALLKQGKLEDAIASYSKAIAINPDLAETYYNLGNALLQQGKLKDAVASYSKAIALKPDLSRAYNNLKLAAKALMFSEIDQDYTWETVANRFNDDALGSVNFALQQFYLDGFRPHEADKSFKNVIAALPTVAGEEIPINAKGHQHRTVAQLPDKMVALVPLGASGSGLLHSLIDGHPEITTLPSVYLRRYFSEGLWNKISAEGWRKIPERFAVNFTALFDARSSFIGDQEGLTSVGENRDQFLSLDREAFCGAALNLMEGMESINPMSFLMVVHAAFEEVIGTHGGSSSNKHLCFYHIHNPDEYGKANFLRYAPDTRLLVTVREPLQNCESCIRDILEKNDYSLSVSSILALLFSIDQVPFRMRDSVGVRLEDIKTRPEATMKALCSWLKVEDSATLYEMTAQGKKYWGTPTDPGFNARQANPFDQTAIKRPVGKILGEIDQFVLGTLLYPFSVRFNYREPEPEQFKKDLKEIRPLIDDMLDFEKALTKRLNTDQDQFKKQGFYKLFRAGMIDRWNVLDELGSYPHMLSPLSIE